MVTLLYLPLQIGALAQLQHLRLSMVYCARDGFAPLSQLSQLSVLELNYCKHFPPPAVLHPLTNLRSLFLDETVLPENEAEADDMLLALPQLTALRFHYLFDVPVLPYAVGQLAQLQRFAWDAGTAEGHSTLPDGPWLASLRRAMLPSFLASNSLHLLYRAARLEYLGLHMLSISQMEEASQECAYSLLDFASEHAPLRRLHLVQPVGLPDAEIAATRAAAPGLSIAVVQSRDELLSEVAPEFVGDHW